MTPRLKIANTVIQRIGSVKKPTTGCLYGLMYQSTLLVVGFNIESGLKDISTQALLENTRKNYKSRINSFPTEVDLCGLITFVEDIDSAEHHNTVIKILEEVDITDNPLLMVCSIVPEAQTSLKTHFYVHDKLVEAAYEVVDESVLWQEFLHVRLSSRLPLICELDTQDIKDAMQSLHKKVASGTLAFYFTNNIYLLGEVEGALSGLSVDSTVGELYNIQREKNKSNESNIKTTKKGQASPLQIDVLNASLLMKPARELHAEKACTAPVIQHVKKSYECLHIWLHIDALSMVSRSAKVAELYPVLVESVCRNLKLTEKSLLEQVEQATSGPDEPFSVSLPQPLHFLPRGFSHFLTLVFPDARSDNQLVAYREILHRELALPTNRPFFRKGCSYFQSIQQNNILVNPHEGVNPSGVKGGEVSLVQGRYSYHHYMQDHIDDNGWGCAYRSLQTLVSWFRWQGYTARAVPSHQEIQECLVKLGDKPSSFIGSSQWIGSTEVSFCLESMLGVTSRILAVSSGEELGSHGGQLAQHFRTQGTPIMIGGGVLAHTILGVDFNRNSGDLKFLILDPHYTGSEDLNIVQTKGWCGWKGLDFWAKNSYYNLCMPQCPVGI